MSMYDYYSTSQAFEGWNAVWFLLFVAVIVGVSYGAASRR